MQKSENYFINSKVELIFQNTYPGGIKIIGFWTMPNSNNIHSLFDRNYNKKH